MFTLPPITEADRILMLAELMPKEKKQSDKDQKSLASLARGPFGDFIEGAVASFFGGITSVGVVVATNRVYNSFASTTKESEAPKAYRKVTLDNQDTAATSRRVSNTVTPQASRFAVPKKSNSLDPFQEGEFSRGKVHDAVVGKPKMSRPLTRDLFVCHRHKHHHHDHGSSQPAEPKLQLPHSSEEIATKQQNIQHLSQVITTLKEEGFEAAAKAALSFGAQGGRPNFTVIWEGSKAIVKFGEATVDEFFLKAAELSLERMVKENQTATDTFNKSVEAFQAAMKASEFSYKAIDHFFDNHNQQIYDSFKDKGVIVDNPTTIGGHWA